MAKINNNLICNTLILSHLLRDNLEIIGQSGLAVGKFKVKRREFHIQLNKFLESTYGKVEGDDLDWLNKGIDDSVDILQSVFKMKLEDIGKVRNFIKSIEE